MWGRCVHRIAQKPLVGLAFRVPEHSPETSARWGHGEDGEDGEILGHEVSPPQARNHGPGRDPRDVTEEFETLLADIQFALLLDGTNKVLGAYVTR